MFLSFSVTGIVERVFLRTERRTKKEKKKKELVICIYKSIIVGTL